MTEQQECERMILHALEKSITTQLHFLIRQKIISVSVSWCFALVQNWVQHQFLHGSMSVWKW